MKTVPKKVDYPWGYSIDWAKTPISTSQILHINAEQTYKWSFNEHKAETVHCLFGSLFITTYDSEEKIWPGESYALDSNVKAVRAGYEAAEVLIHSVNTQ